MFCRASGLRTAGWCIRRVAFVSTALALGGLLVPAGVQAASAAPPTWPQGTLTARTEVAAAQLARSRGAPVEVGEMRTATQEVFAQPDGTLVATVSLRPERVIRPDGSAVPLDTRLAARPDGTIAPRATAVGMALSGGGSTELVRLQAGDKSLTFHWTAELPAPVVQGDTATYPEVFPGVDLSVRSDADGFSEFLTVTSAAAAANPALSTVRFPIDAVGLAVQVDPDGTLRAVDSAGGTVFRSPPPAMWDSPAPGVPPADPDEGPDTVDVPGAHVGQVGVAVNDGALEITPDQSILTDPTTVFPVVIDPHVTTMKHPAWHQVNGQSQFRGSPHWQSVPTNLFAVGFQNYQSPPSTVRTFLRFGIDSRIWGGLVTKASVRLNEVWASSCNARPIQMFTTGGFGSGTSWNNMPGLGALQAERNVAFNWRRSGQASPCPGGNVEFDVRPAAQAAASGRKSVVNFVLKATNESDPLGWKKFDPNAPNNNDAQLTITFNHAPNAPGRLSTTNPNSGCATTPARAPRLNVPKNNGITLNAAAVDPDGDQVRLAVQVRNPANQVMASSSSGLVGSGAVVSSPRMLVGAALQNGAVYRWTATASDVNGTPNARAAPWCYFVQDAAFPAPPVVRADCALGPCYGSDQYTGAPGKEGVFRFSPGAVVDTDVTKYRYGIDDQPTITVTADAAHNAAPRVLPTTSGPHDLLVQAIDAANNASSSARYHFYVNAANDPLALWKFEEGTGSTATGTKETDPDTPGPQAVLPPAGVTWDPFEGTSGHSLSFDGTDGASLIAPATRVNTTASFTVSAWVDMRTSDGRSRTAVSQDGNRGSGFYLGYDATANKWEFTMLSADADTGVTTFRATSQGTARPLSWAYLTGVYDGAARTLRLYLNGQLAQEVAVSSPWDATGAVRIGGGKLQGVQTNPWKGWIDEVRVYDRALSPAEVADLLNGGGVGPADSSWSFTETGGATVSSGRRPFVNWLDGAAQTPAGHDGHAALFNGTTSWAWAAQDVHTNRSFTAMAWVRLDGKGVAGSGGAVLSQQATTASGFVLQYQNSGDSWAFLLPTSDTTNAPRVTASAPAPAVGVWTHLAGAYDQAAGQIRLYVNGVLKQQLPAPAPTFDTQHGMTLGRVRWNGSLVNPLKGAVDQVRLANRALGTQEITALAADGPGGVLDGSFDFEGTGFTTDSTGHQLGLSPGATLGAAGHSGGSVTLDGSTGAASSNASVVETDRTFSVSTWVRLEHDDIAVTIVSQDGHAGPGFSLSFVPDTAAGAWRFSLPDADGGVAPAPAVVPATFDTAGAWVHLGAVYDGFGHTLKLRVTDSFGSSVGYGTQPTPWDAGGPLQVGRELAIGDTATYQDFFAGQIDDVGVYDFGLTEADLRNLAGQG